MKTIVINLPNRSDRIRTFNSNNPNLAYELFNAVEGYKIDYHKLREQGFDVQHDWIDPILNTPLTKGEVGCFLSHWHIWNKCIEKNESILVLEDDAILTDDFSMEEVEGLAYDFVYLGWKEMEESEDIDGFSIGSNDLTQLTLGLDRDSSLVAHIYDERNPAVKRSISSLIKAARKSNTKVGICGQGPSDYPDFAQFLVEEGIDTISVTPDSMLKTIKAIHKIENKKHAGV